MTTDAERERNLAELLLAAAQGREAFDAAVDALWERAMAAHGAELAHEVTEFLLGETRHRPRRWWRPWDRLARRQRLT